MPQIPSSYFSFHQENKETMSPQEKLSRLRLQVIDLLKDWGTEPFEEKKNVFNPYLNHLFTIAYQGDHQHKRDVMADLEVLKGLLALLEPDIAEGRGSYIRFQMAVVNGHKKLGMLLQEVDRKLKEGIIIPDDAFQKWIDEVLVKEDWNGYLDFVDTDEFLVLHKAKASGVQVEQLTVTREDIDVANLDDIEKRLKMYRKELENAYEMPQDNVDCIAHGPSVCESIEEIMSKLKDRCLEMPDDDIMEEGSDGVQTTVKADDNAELASDGWTGRKKSRTD